MAHPGCTHTTASGWIPLKRFDPRVRGMLPNMSICSSLVQPLKGSSPILITLSGIVIDVKAVQSLKASSPILVTLSGIVIDVVAAKKKY